MKKIFSLRLFILALLSGCMLVSCEQNTLADDGGNGDGGGKTQGEFIDPSTLSNGQAAFNYELIDIKSVMYTTAEEPGYTVLYMSPFDCRSLDDIYDAGSYIRMVIESNESGYSNNFSSGSRNSIEYIKSDASVARASSYNTVFYVDSDNASEYRITTFKALFESATAVEIEVTITARDGSSQFAIRYFRECERTSENIADEAEGVCTIVAQAVYFGKGQITDAHEYDLLVSSSPLTSAADGSLVMQDKEGYAMHIAFFAYPDTSNRLILKDGRYRYSNIEEAGTYISGSYIGVFSKPDENKDQIMDKYFLDGDIIVSTVDGITTIRAYYVKDGRRRLVAFEGKIGSFYNYTHSGTYLPQMAEDVDFTAIEADGIYYGQYSEEAYGTYELVLCGEGYNGATESDRKENSFAATLMLTNPNLFIKAEDLDNVENLKKLEGTYHQSNTFTEYWTWFSTIEVNAFGMVYPLGTYVHKYDGTYYGQFGYAQEGTVDIKVDDDGIFDITFEFVSRSENTMKGSYHGPVAWKWQPVSTTTDDGTSTLTADYDLNDPDNEHTIARFKEARLVAPSSIYIGGIGSCPMTEYKKKWGSESVSKNDDIGYQYIAIGNIGANDDETGTGDHVYIELITAPGEEHMLKPGHYTVSPERWPAYFHPMEENEGVAMKGMLLANIAYTSHWQHHYWTGESYTDEEGNVHSAPGTGMSFMDGHAYFYGGEVTVKANDDGTYTFDMDFTCVRKHHVHGSWTGTVTGITPAESAAMLDSWHAPMLLPGQSSATSVVGRREWPLLPLDVDVRDEVRSMRNEPEVAPVMFNRLTDNN